MLPMNDTDFWWLRYVLGIAVPVPVSLLGLSSIITQHSYVYLRNQGFIRVDGTQAVVVGVAYLGIALMLFANCYLQYHERMAYHYQWLVGAGAVMTIIGGLWCIWIFVAH